MSADEAPAPPSPAGAQDLGLFLAGFFSEADACRRLGLGPDRLERLLREHVLSNAAMAPAEVDDQLDVFYRDIGRMAFDRPLYDDVLRRDGGAPGALRFILSADAILDAPSGMPSAEPAGLIFHVGRCGSNLLCNLLAEVPGVVTLREPEFVNTLLLGLGAEADVDRRDRLEALTARLLRSLAHGVRRDAQGRPRCGLVKFSSWNALFAEILAERLPSTSCIVVVREPCETVASYLQEPPYWYDPGRRTAADAVRYFAGEWSAVVASALRLPPERTLIVSYPDLVADPAGVREQACRHLGICPAPADALAVEAVMSRYSKSSGPEAFDPAGRRLRPGLDPGSRDLVAAITARSRAALLERISIKWTFGGRERDGRSSRI